METSITIMSALVALLLAPGPTDTLLAASGATFGFTRSSPLLLAAIAGYSTTILSIRYVVGPTLVNAHPLVLRSAARVYLIFLTVRLWKVPPEFGSHTAVSFGQMYLTTLLNPKAAIAALVILPFGSAHDLVYLLSFAMLIAPTGAVWILVGTFLARYFIRGRTQFIPRLTAAALGLFTVVLVASTLR